jgi:elongator complex protein 3
MDNVSVACRELIEKLLRKEITNEQEMNLAKKDVSKRYKLSALPGNSHILTAAYEDEKEDILEFLKLKPVRTISGVAVIAAMTSPSPCPHGLCIPCPGGPSSKFQSPQSYMGAEPAARRAFENNFDPYQQVSSRLKQLSQIGHPVEKAELIVMGGTYTSRTLCYQEWFVKRAIEAMNDFFDTDWREPKKKYIFLQDAQSANETARIRNVGITIETRPDWTKNEHIDIILGLGATKVEIGVQSTYDFVLAGIQRGHTVKESAEANTRLRDSGLKVGFHMMPGLPGSTMGSDLRMFRTLFEDERFKPDYLKIYPTLVTEGTQLHGMWELGNYEPPEVEETVELLAKIKSIMPKWVRLQRIQRDIPAYQVLAGIRKSHIRELAKKRLLEMGGKCRCIRCREVGHRILAGVMPENIELMIEKYRACGGFEHFISFEDTEKDILIGFTRLRFPGSPHRKELEDTVLIRELHIYGSMVPAGESAGEAQWQHRGYGEELLERAEETAGSAGYHKIAVMSGIGVRDYYRKFGYEREGPYMVKKL